MRRRGPPLENHVLRYQDSSATALMARRGNTVPTPSSRLTKEAASSGEELFLHLEKRCGLKRQLAPSEARMLSIFHLRWSPRGSFSTALLVADMTKRCHRPGTPNSHAAKPWARKRNRPRLL